MPESTVSTTLTPDTCREYLKAVIDPEIYHNIVDLGLIYDIAVDDDDSVDVTMTFTTPQCPMGPQIVQDVKDTLHEKGAGAVTVNIVWEPMWTPDAMTEELKRELGILEAEEEPTLEIDPPPPPPPPKKRGFFGRLFGRS
jgi:metal-sulfur cluster biosynthetic enzyme